MPITASRAAPERRRGPVGSNTARYYSSTLILRSRSIISCDLRGRPSQHRFLLLGDQFRPRVALESTTGQLRLIGTVNLCRAGSPQPSYSRPDPCHSIDFTPPRFRFRQSLVARRRSARAYRRPRARARRGEGVQDMQLDGTVASRRIWRSSRSPVPVPVAHCAPRMQCRSTPPTLVPRPHRG